MLIDYDFLAHAFGCTREEAKRRVLLACYTPTGRPSWMKAGYKGSPEKFNVTAEVSPYVSPDFSARKSWTILEYLALYRPDLLALMEDTPEQLTEDTKRDGWWLLHRCREQGLRPEKVPAPSILQTQGVDEVNAYPRHLLEQRFA